MKKIFWILLGSILSLLLLIAGFFWYATAKAELEVVGNNALFLRQQLYLEHYQLAFDYDKLSIGSHFLQPKIVMHNPYLQFATGEGVYKLSAQEIHFIGGLGGFGEYEIRLPDKLVYEKLKGDEKAVTLRVIYKPVVTVKSSLPEDKQEVGNTLLERIRFERNKPLALEIKHKKGISTLVFKPPMALAERWHPVRYQVYPYINQFSQSVRRAMRHAEPEENVQ